MSERTWRAVCFPGLGCVDLGGNEMKIIVGFFTTKPGKRDEYLAAAQNHLQKSRLDPDCLYIELIPMPDRPDT